MSSIPLDALGSSQNLRNHSPLLEHEIEDAYASCGPSEDEPISTSATTKAPPWKRELYALLEHPTSSPSAFVIHVFTTALIIISALVTMLETVPAFHEISVGTWFGLETSLVALFTVEYVARCFAWSLSWKTFFQWAGSFFGIIDLLAILPYYIEIALHQDTSTLFRFSILRTFRLLRVFRAFRYNNILLLTIEVMYLSFRRSQHALLALSFFVAMVLIVFSTLLYFIERGTWDDTLGVFINSDGDPSQFASIPAAGWFVLVTITTVGYGEITPRSFLGRLITLPLLIFGLLLIALPSFVLGREFSIVWNEMISQEESPERNDHRSPMLTPASPTLSRNGPSQFGTQRSVSRGRRSLEIPNGDRAQTPPTRNLDQRQASEMSQQIAELRSIIERQGEMLRQLLERDAYARRDS